MAVSERLRSSWSPSRLAHHDNLRSSQWSKPQNFNRPPFGWTTTTTKSLPWYPFRCVEWKATLVTEAEFYAVIPGIFIFLWIRLLFIHKTHALSSLFSNYHLIKLAIFYEFQSGRISLNVSLSDSVLETKKPQASVNSTCRTILIS